MVVVRSRLVTKYSMAILRQHFIAMRGERARRILLSTHSRAATRPFSALCHLSFSKNCSVRWNSSIVVSLFRGISTNS
eukprot:2719580-Pyramimonas_sp.AAC.1